MSTHHVLLTKGGLNVDHVNETKIRAAIEAGDRLVDIHSPIEERHRQYNNIRPVMLVVAHVLAISPHEPKPLALAVPPAPEPPWLGSGSYAVGMIKPLAQTVRSDGAAAIRQAILDNKKMITVGVEVYPGSEEVWPVSYVVAHIVSVTEIPKPLRDLVADAGPKVTAIWERRQQR